MKRLALTSLLALLAAAPACSQVDTSEAETAALDWLKTVDAEDYAESLRMSGSVFRDRLTEEQWARSASAARSPFGQIRERRISTANATRDLPNAPPGDYVVMQTQAEFENRTGTETVTVVLEDGQWRVVGYFIR